MDTLGGSIVHIILLLFFYWFPNLSSQERDVSGEEIEGQILILY